MLNPPLFPFEAPCPIAKYISWVSSNDGKNQSVYPSFSKFKASLDAIGVSEPMGIYINSYGTSNVNLSDAEIAKEIEKIFDMRPYFIEKRLKLREPIYQETASYGHMGRSPSIVNKKFIDKNGHIIEKKVELFTWEKLDYVDKIKKTFKI